MREPVDFEVDGHSFEFNEMPLTKSCESLQLVLELTDGVGGLAAALGKAIGKLPALVDAFAPFCKVQGPETADRQLKVKDVKEALFNGRLERAILFVVNCAVAEHGDFLGAGIERLMSSVKEALEASPALRARLASFGG